MKSVVIDTDIGIDDAMALLFLHFSEEVKLLAITTRFGNASVENTTRNALAITELFGIEAPVYRGAAEPLEARLGEGYPDFVHGKNGLGYIELSDPQSEVDSLSAAQALVELSLKSEEKISIVAVAGLTNIAKAISLDATFVQRVDELVVMGGVFGYNQHKGNVSPVAEANIASDPLAADIVFSSELPTTIVGLDVTHEVLMDEVFIQSLIDRAGKAGQFIADISKFYFEFHQCITGKFECPVHDSSAVAYLLRPDLFDVISRPVRVVIEGIAMGQTIHGDDVREYASDAWNNIPPCNICTGVDAAELLKFYQTTLAQS